jgi:hypothetical protein
MVNPTLVDVVANRIGSGADRLRESTDRKLGRRTVASSASGIRAELHLQDRLRTVLVLDGDGNLPAGRQLCEHGCESNGRRGRAVVHRLDRVAGPNPRLRGSPTRRDGADEDAVPVRISHADAEEGAMRIDDLAVSDDLSGDVGDQIARDREADSRRAAAQLGIGRGERGYPDHATRDVDQSTT